MVGLTLLLIEFLDFGAVAVGAGLGRWRIEEDLLSIDSFKEFVASGTLYAPVLTLQSKGRALVVIE